MPPRLPRRSPRELEQLALCHPGPARESGLVHAEVLDRPLRIRQGLRGTVVLTQLDLDACEVAERHGAHRCPLVGQRRAQGLLAGRFGGGQLAGVVGGHAEVDVRDDPARRRLRPGCARAHAVPPPGRRRRRRAGWRARPAGWRDPPAPRSSRPGRAPAGAPCSASRSQRSHSPRLIEVERGPSPCEAQARIGQHGVVQEVRRSSGRPSRTVPGSRPAASAARSARPRRRSRPAAVAWAIASSTLPCSRCQAEARRWSSGARSGPFARARAAAARERGGGSGTTRGACRARRGRGSSARPLRAARRRPSRPVTASQRDAHIRSRIDVAQQELAQPRRLLGEHLVEVVADQPVAAGEVPAKACRSSRRARRERGQLQSGRPPLGSRSQELDVGRLEAEAERAVEQLLGLRLAEAKVGRPDLGHLAGRAQTRRAGAAGRRGSRSRGADARGR